MHEAMEWEVVGFDDTGNAVKKRWPVTNVLAQAIEQFTDLGLRTEVRQSQGEKMDKPYSSLEDVFLVRESGNAITVYFSEIKSAKAFRDTFPPGVLDPSIEYQGEIKRPRLELADK